MAVALDPGLAKAAAFGAAAVPAVASQSPAPPTTSSPAITTNINASCVPIPKRNPARFSAASPTIVAAAIAALP